MKPLDIALAVAVAVIWGVGFVLTRMAVDEMSSTLLTTLRFGITALPCLFLPKPKLSWLLIVATSWLLVAQFLAQTYGMAHGVPAGLTSVIVQSQALFTVGAAALFLRELPTRQQVAGIVIAMGGLLMICFTVGYDFSVFPFHGADDRAGKLCVLQSAAAARAGRADARPVRAGSVSSRCCRCWWCCSVSMARARRGSRSRMPR